jgi:hypothetical protein
MGVEKSVDDDQSPPYTAAERRLRGDVADHTDDEEARNPDTELHLDDEKDTLYDDGLDLEDDPDTLAWTRGNSSGIKP